MLLAQYDFPGSWEFDPDFKQAPVKLPRVDYANGCCPLGTIALMFSGFVLLLRLGI